ncbi:MAG: type IX secretion system sortase PorU, partial [Bacteroidales bacterium]|nr:type IX secretion system sortase PorU [Bacteroidales bacterium]
MKKIIYIHFSLILVLLIGFQTDTIASATIETDTLSINWEAHQEIQLRDGGLAKLLYFEDAITQYETASLPWQITELPLANNEMAQNLQLTVIAADTLSYSTENEPADLQFASNDFQLTIQLLEGKSYANVLPLKLIDGKLIRIIAYKLSYTITEKLKEESDGTPSWKNNSVLATGTWFKIGITESGVYILDYQQLELMGLKPEDLDPARFGLFGNGNGMLPEANHHSRKDDLIENAIVVNSGDDGSFDHGDHILFYGQNAVKWKYSPFTNQYTHEQNYYSDTTFYFFTPDLPYAGKRIQPISQATGQPISTINSFLDFQLHEEESENLILSGKDWYGEVLSIANPIATASFNFPNLITERSVGIYTKYAARSISEITYSQLHIDGQIIQDSTKIYKLSTDNPMYAREKTFSTNYVANSDQLEVKLKLIAHETDSRLWLDYVRVNAWRQLKTVDNKLLFRFLAIDTLPTVVNLEVAGVKPSASIWDITDLSNIKAQEFTSSSNTAHFKVSATVQREFYTFFAPHSLLSPASIFPVSNQNLHKLQHTEMLVITHPKFLAQANEIAELHRVVDQMDVEVVNVKQIYNEFGGGTADITALRDFIRMVYIRSNKQLKYVLLFGDASYDYKDRIPANTNYIPTYQASGSTIETQSFVSDDYFGLMDNSEGANMSGILDLGIGRFPVNTVNDAQIMVDKVRHYLLKQEELSGQWRNNIAFVGDDGNGNLHFNQAETLSRIVDTARANLNVSKIFLDAYPRETVPGGFRYPDANKAFVKQIEDGALIINYTGHGGINGLTDERVFTISDINGLENINNMPFFITATCEFSRFDNPAFVSAGEQLLLTPKGGGIALMTTTRLAFAHTNFALNKKVYAAMFDRSDTAFKRLGDILRISKNPTSSSVYNFVLLGDPALKLVYPESKVITKKVNNANAGSTEVVLHAMAELSIEGEIHDPNGNLASDFNGYLYPKLFDKKTKFTTLGNSSDNYQAPFSYYE